MRLTRNRIIGVFVSAVAIAAVAVGPALGGPSLKKLVKKEVSKQLAGKEGPQGPAGIPGVPGASSSSLIGRATSTTGVTGAGMSTAVNIPLTGTTSWTQRAGELNMIVGKMQYDRAAALTCPGLMFIISTTPGNPPLTQFRPDAANNFDGGSDNVVSPIPMEWASVDGELISSAIPILLAPESDTPRTLTLEVLESGSPVQPGDCDTDHHHIDSVELQIYKIG